MNLFRSNSLERRRVGGLEQIRSRYMKRPIVLTPEQERRRARIARITPKPRFMNVLPSSGNWCLPRGDKKSQPLVCFETYQEAFEYDGFIPETQGTNARGTPRYVECNWEEVVIKNPPNAPQRIIYRVKDCINLTGKPRRREDAEPLTGYGR